MAAVKTLGLTRDQLALFLKDHQSIKAFENLFLAIESLQAQNTPQDITAIENSLAYVESRTTEATQTIQGLKDSIDLALLTPPEVPAKRVRYGSFYDTTTQTAAAINTAYAMTLNTTDLSRGVRLRSPSTSEVEIDQEGVYNIQFSAQLDNTSGGNHLVFVWLRVNGVDVPNSASQVRLKGTDGELVASWNFFYQFKALDYFQIMWSVTDVAVQIISQAAAAPVPAIPSVILTVSNNIS